MATTNFYKEWGESGTLCPTLIPDTETKARLVELQTGLYDQLVENNPEIQKVEKLHATIIYLKPARLLELMRKHIDRRIKAERLYPHFMATLSMFLLHSKPSEVPVRVGDLSRLGANGSILGVTLDHQDFADASFITRDWIQLIMREFGMDDEAAKRILQEEPSLWWALSSSIPHISLLSGVKDRPPDLRYVLPERAVFDGVNIGSATKSPTDPKDLFWWHLRGLPGDPLRSENSPKYKE